MSPKFDTNVDGLPVNPDLQKERDRASFDKQELTHILDGGAEKTKRRKELEKIIYSDPAFSSKDLLYLNKSEQYENAVARSVKLAEWSKKYNWSDEDRVTAAQQINTSTEAITLHREMFIPALQRLGTEEQKAKWLSLALNYKIIGTYAQTELGHGTNLRNLETTATFDKSADQFVLNTPKITSMKWWPGALGKSSTHAIVLAQLVIDSKNYGLQGFVVQLRSLDDHQPMPGITLGDIGPKLTINYIDNGFLILNNVRIPRDHMLMGNCEVTKDGQFKKLKADKSNYSTMMYVRVMITRWAYGCVGHGALVAVRYSAVRRQLYINPNAGEVQILDYQTQQYKLFPAIALGYALFFMSRTLMADYNQVLPRLINGDRAVLAEYHSLTSAMKAISSDLATKHLEIMRRSLGGHGFMMLSGLPNVCLSALTLVTVEGDNTVLYQQVARDLLKQFYAAQTGGQPSTSTAYLGQEYPSVNLEEAGCRDANLLLQLYMAMAKRVITSAAFSFQAELGKGIPEYEAWNQQQVHLVRAAQAHSIMQVVRYNVQGVHELQKSASPELVKVLDRLCCLFALYNMEVNSGWFMETKVLSPSQMQCVRTVMEELLSEIRPDAVALVDAADVPDESHHSVLGCYDGNVYPRMYAAALAEPMNKTQVHPSYEKHLKHMIKGPTSKL